MFARGEPLFYLFDQSLPCDVLVASERSGSGALRSAAEQRRLNPTVRRHFDCSVLTIP
jgi:hypothetical protein